MAISSKRQQPYEIDESRQSDYYFSQIMNENNAQLLVYLRQIFAVMKQISGPPTVSIVGFSVQLVRCERWSLCVCQLNNIPNDVNEAQNVSAPLTWTVDGVVER